jgi:mRNA interferase HigB
MQVISVAMLRVFWGKHPQAEGPLRAWVSIVRHAEWISPQNVKNQFGTTVDFLGDNRVVFDIAGNKYRLIVRVSYRFRRLLLKFIGTHAEYDRSDAETIGR